MRASLIERNHSLVSDDVTRFRRQLKGESWAVQPPDMIRYHMRSRHGVSSMLHLSWGRVYACEKVLTW